MKCLDTIETEWLQYSTIANLENVEDKGIFLSISCTADGLHDKSCVSSNMLFGDKRRGPKITCPEILEITIASWEIYTSFIYNKGIAISNMPAL